MPYIPIAKARGFTAGFGKSGRTHGRRSTKAWLYHLKMARSCLVLRKNKPNNSLVLGKLDKANLIWDACFL